MVQWKAGQLLEKDNSIILSSCSRAIMGIHQKNLQNCCKKKVCFAIIGVYINWKISLLWWKLKRKLHVSCSITWPRCIQFASHAYQWYSKAWWKINILYLNKDVFLHNYCLAGTITFIFESFKDPKIPNVMKIVGTPFLLLNLVCFRDQSTK